MKKISVITTSYNCEAFIAHAIESVLNSTYKNFEYVIVDDVSSDNSFAIIEEFARNDSRIRLYKNTHNLGDYPNRKYAISLCSGDYIKFVDCDDYILPQTLEVMIDAMEKYPDVSIGLCQKGNSLVRLLTSREAYLDPNGILEYYGPTGAIIRRSDYFLLGEFLEIITISDWEFWHRAAAHSSVLAFPENLVVWRDHENNALKSHKHRMGVIENYLFRKKQVFSASNCPLTLEEKGKFLRKYASELFLQSLKWSFEYMNVRYFLFFVSCNFFLCVENYKGNDFK